MTYDAMQPEDAITAIDLALEGHGEEVTSERRDVSISDSWRVRHARRSCGRSGSKAREL
jgi:hypothetical protein